MMQPSIQSEIKSQASQKPENPWINILVNVVFPVIIMNKFSDEAKLGPYYSFLLAMSLPVLYGAYDFFKRRKHNFLSILGFVSILLTGGLGLLQVDGFWFAVKEAAVPLLIGLAVLGSLYTRFPIVKTILFNEQLMDTERISKALADTQSQSSFEKLLKTSSYLLAVSFFLSAILNFVLAIVILKSPAGTKEFNEELSRMMVLSYPVIVVPSMAIFFLALWRLTKGIQKLTGIPFEEFFRQAKGKAN